MDPNNQPINTNPLGQQPAAPQPVSAPISNPDAPLSQPTQPPTQSPTPPPPTTPTPAPAPAPESSKGGSKKGIILIIILIILILGMGYYVLFAKKQLSKPSSNTSTNIPVVTTMPSSPTPATADEITVASPEEDLQSIEKDVQGL